MDRSLPCLTLARYRLVDEQSGARVLRLYPDRRGGLPGCSPVGGALASIGEQEGGSWLSI
jgi:hypothetical protein